MRHRKDWEDLNENDLGGMLHAAIMRKPFDQATVSDLIWLTDKRYGKETSTLFTEYLQHHLREHIASGGGLYAGERKVWTLLNEKFPMRWIPAGTFLMGSAENDPDDLACVIPQREITITRGFWMGETPVTQRQYQAITGQNPSYFTTSGLDAPVEQVSWYDAVTFANKLCEMEGLSACFVGTDKQLKGARNDGNSYLGCKGWRLPTEAEWEYAARAGTTAPRYGALKKIAWYGKNSGCTTQQVRKKDPNAWGLYDMLGNVWEWTYDATHYRDNTDLGTTDPLRIINIEGGGSRVLRGGSWGSGARYVRSNSRYYDGPMQEKDSIGFRLVIR